jgi:hypothetical protein
MIRPVDSIVGGPPTSHDPHYYEPMGDDVIETARKEFIRQRVEELVAESPRRLIGYACSHYPARMDMMLAQLPTVESLLSLDELMRRAAEEIAQHEWVLPCCDD